MAITRRSLLRVVLLVVVAFVVSAPLRSRALLLPSLSWSGPHHAYVLLKSQTNAYSVETVPLDNEPSKIRILSGPLTGLCEPAALAIGPQGNLYVAGKVGSKCNPAIAIFAKGASGNVAPVAHIQGPMPNLRGPGGMAFDRQGRLYVVQGTGGGHLGGAIKVFAARAHGNIAPIAEINGPNTMLSGDGALCCVAVDGAGDVFAGEATTSSSPGNLILKFAPGSSGNVAPVATGYAGQNPSIDEIQVSGDTVYVSAGGFLKFQPPPGVYMLSKSNLAATGSITSPHFRGVYADADSAGNVYAQSAKGTGTGTLFEYRPNRQHPFLVFRDIPADTLSSYVAVGP